MVVLDCQPPSKMRTNASPTSAILLPCRYTVDTPSSVVTEVLALVQFLFALIAAFIRVSILRMVLLVKVTDGTDGLDSESRHRSKVVTCLNLASQIVQPFKAVVFLNERTVKSTIKIVEESKCLSSGESDLDVVAHEWCSGQQNQYRVDGVRSQPL